MVILSSEGVEAEFIFGTYQINWIDVDLVFYAWGNIIFEGKEKTLSLPGLEHWQGSTQYEIKEMIENLSGHEVQVSYQLKKYFPIWKKTQVPKNS